MIDSVILDLDGTLLNDALEISEENKHSLRQLDALGIPYFIATGRPEQLAKPIVSELNYERPMIMYNGSVIGHPFKNERLYSEAIAADDFKTVIEYCNANNMIVMLYTQYAIYTDPNYRRDFFLERNKALKAKDKAVFKTMAEFDGNEEVNKILIIEHDPGKRKRFIDYFYNNETLANHLSFVQSQPSFMDINPKGTSKGQAIDRLFKALNINRENTLAIGDQDNDISMKAFVHTFGAMGNASDSVKDVADFVTWDNNHHGVSVAIEKYVLNEQMFK